MGWKSKSSCMLRIDYNSKLKFLKSHDTIKILINSYWLLDNMMLLQFLKIVITDNNLTIMQLKQVHYEDVLTNILVKSKSILEEVTKGDHKMNYRKRYDNPKQFEVSYIDALANLEEINELFKKRINNKNKHYNFFLDNSDNPLIEKAIEPQLYNQYLNHIKNGKIYAYTLENTWTKGKQFFFIKKGSVMSVVKIYQDRIFVDVKYHGSVGLMKIEDLKIILQDLEDIQQIEE